jgi:hypothetical protein
MKQDKNIKTTHTQKLILDLEKKYFNELSVLFQDQDFFSSLVDLQIWISSNYKRLHSWKKANKCDLAVERLINFHTNTHYQEKIKKVYASPISSDIAFETDDAIINIDSKTVNFFSNELDWNQLQIGPNQSSFKNKNYFATHNYPGIPVEFHVDSRDSLTQKPVFTFILMIMYNDNGSSFTWHKRNKDFHIKFCCIPNGELSNLFHNDLIQNIKTYKYKTEMNSKGKIVTIKKRNYPSNAIKVKVGRKPCFYDVSGKDTYGIIKSPNYSIIESTNTIRMSFEDLKKRYDSVGVKWDGYREWDIA